MGRGIDLSELIQGWLPGAGGLRIFWRAWASPQSPRAVIAIAHGVSEHGERYRHVARRLIDEGYAVYAPDHRGHGRSGGPRALIDTMDNAVADLDALILIARERHPNLPLFLLGHSMGGTLALSYAVAHQDRLAGLILSGPLAALEAAPPHMRLAARVLSAVAPGLPLIAIDAKQVSRDPAVVAAYDSDPLVHHGRLPVRTVFELAKAVDALPDAVGRITVPTLIMYGTADGLCPPRGSMMLAERVGAPVTKIRAYEGLYHEILNEPERDRVLDDVCAWLGERLAAVAA